MTDETARPEDTTRPGEAAETGAPAGATPAPQPARRRGMSGSAMSMFISMALVLGLTLVFVAIVPRMKEGSAYQRIAVDVTKDADKNASSAEWDVSVPVNLPRDWEARNSKFGISTDDVETWHMGYKAPTGQYVALEEALDVSKDWLAGCAGHPTGEQDVLIQGVRWTQYSDDTRNHFALVRQRSDGLTTVVSGPVATDVLAEFAAALQPRPKPTGLPTDR